MTGELLEFVRDDWDTLYLFKEHFGKREFEKHGVNEDEYCALGADAACLELMIQDPEFHLERIRISRSLNDKQITGFLLHLSVLLIGAGVLPWKITVKGGVCAIAVGDGRRRALERALDGDLCAARECPARGGRSC